MKQKLWDQESSQEILEPEQKNSIKPKNPASKKIKKNSSGHQIKIQQGQEFQKYKFIASDRTCYHTIPESQRSQFLSIKKQYSFYQGQPEALQSFAKELQQEQLKQQTQKHQEGLFRLKKSRRKHFIEVNKRSKQRYLKVVQGCKDETTELNINIKTNIRNWFRYQAKSVNMTQEEAKLLQIFYSQSACFQVFRNLFGCQEYQKIKNQIKEENLEEDIQRLEIPYVSYQQMQKHEEKIFNTIQKTKKIAKNKAIFVSKKSDNIRKVFLKYLSSTQYLKNIYSSCRMIFFSKTIALKYIEQTRNASIYPQRFYSWKSSANFL